MHCLDVLDYPTPLIALKDFVNEVEQSLLRGKQVQDALSGYWQRQKTLQHTSFYETLFEYINEDGLAQDISPFDFDNKVRNDLHLDSSTS